MIRKLASVTAFVLMAHLGMSAAYSLVVHKTDGKDEAFVLEKKPVVTFDETDMLVTLGENVVAITRSEITNIDFADVTGGITLPETVGDIIEFIDDNTINVAGCPSGVYIINYNDKSLKIIKK